MIVTEKAKSALSRMAKDDSNVIRVRIKGGGCAGFTYVLEYSEEKVDDIVITAGTARLVMDQTAADLLTETTLDYSDGLSGRGFTWENKRATGACGCGLSFGM